MLSIDDMKGIFAVFLFLLCVMALPLSVMWAFEKINQHYEKKRNIEIKAMIREEKC